MWHRGGGHKRLYRMIDFKRDLTGVMGTIRRLEYDPNRSTHIALVDFEDGHKPRYVLARTARNRGTRRSRARRERHQGWKRVASEEYSVANDDS